MKKLNTWGMCGVSLALMLVSNGFAQQSTPPPATDYTPAAPGAAASTPTTQVGTAPATSVETSPGIPLPAEAQNSALPGRIDAQPRTNAISGPASEAFPAPAGRQESFGGERRDIDLSSGGQDAGQRAELGVWLVESGGPGVQIRRITAGGAADRAGLQPGDVILQINGRGAMSPHGIAQMIREMPAGQTAVVEYWRDGQTDEMEIVLQPARERHDVAFRGDESRMGMNRATGDIESRTMRLEEQLAMVVQELRQLRQEMTQLRSSGSSQTAIGGGGIGETTTASGLETGSATSTTIEEPEAAITQPAATPPAAIQPAEDATLDDAFGASTTEPAEPAIAPATETGAEPTIEPAAEPATESTDEGDDLFGESTTEEPAATEADSATEADPATEETTPPADDEAATEEAPAEEAESDDLFE